jgi:hypothetical protein
VQSDVWSLGLSLVELAIGRYPVPSLSREQYASLFNKRLEDIHIDDAKATKHAASMPAMAPAAIPTAGSFLFFQHFTSYAFTGNDSPKTMAIFELLDYIVNEVSFFLNICFSNSLSATAVTTKRHILR